MPAIKKQKSFRERIQSNEQTMQPVSATALAKGGEFGSSNIRPAVPSEETLNSLTGPKQSEAPSPQIKPEDQVDESDQQVTDYIAKSQTLDGPESAEVPPEEVPNPAAFNRFYQKWKRVPSQLNPEDKKMFQDKLAQLDQKMIESEQIYKENKNRLAWAELAETLGQAVIQLIAAQDAAKNNWNISGMKFDRVNWESKYDRALREFDSKKDTLSKQQGAVTREFERAEGKMEREGTKEQSLLARDFFTTQARIEANAKRAAKEDADKLKDMTAKERAAREKSRMYIANYEAAEDAVNKLENGDFADDKEKQKLKDEITDSMRKNGHIGVSKDLAKAGEAKTGGIFGFFQSDDFAPMKKYIQVNKKKGVESVYRGYGVPIPADVNQALSGEEQQSGPKAGDVVDGFQFKGGDPGDKNNWIELK